MRKLLIAVSVFIPGAVLAQDYGAMLQQQMQQFNQLGAQMQAMEQQIVQQNMNNPQIQAMYRNYLAQGGTMSFQQFAYNYAATGGFTAEGMARYRQNEMNIQQREQAAINAYRQNQAQNNEVLQQRHRRNAEIAHQRGNLLEGTTDYRDPATGTQYNLPHTAEPNSWSHNPNTGENFHRDGLGNYRRQDPNGYWYDLEEDE